MPLTKVGYTKRLIDNETDEWQSIAQIWDDIRTKCDEDGKKGKYILSDSSAPVNQKVIFHSGAGRIYKLNMYTMSLYESGDSSGVVSLKSLFDNENININLKEKPTLDKFADLLIRGGWPASLQFDPKNYYRLPEVLLLMFLTMIFLMMELLEIKVK